MCGSHDTGNKASLQSYAAFRRAIRSAGLELHDGRATASRMCIGHRAGQRDGNVRVVRFSSRLTGRRITIRVKTEDDLIDDGDAAATTQSDAVHNESKPDLGGW